MSQIYKKILIVKRFGVKKIGENAIVKLNEAIKDLTPNSNRPHPRPQSASPPRGCVKMYTSSFLCTKPRLSQARALLFPKVFVPLGIQKFSL